MLTRLEADGFKNLLGFSMDFGPYTCIAGANAVGKSNIFDAIEFLALLADHPFMEAAQRLRSSGTRGADPRSLFFQSETALEGVDPIMTLAAEMIVPENVEDDFGRLAKATTTYLRYEVQLQYQGNDSGVQTQPGRIVLIREELRHINKGDAPTRLRWPHSARHFRDSVILGRRSGVAYISTDIDDHGQGVVSVHQDGGSRGKARTSPASGAPRTVVSTTTTSDDPTILATRREMQQWRMLALEPSAMRSPDSASDTSHIAGNGAHLAAALYRMAAKAEGETYGEVASDAAALTDIREVNVDFDRRRELLSLEARLGRGPLLPARALSDGTLRFLALCIIRLDPEFNGVICMEEPENGIHPGRMNAMVDLVKSLAVDPAVAPDASNPMRQVIVNTHSPYFVSLQDPADLLLAVPAEVSRGDADRRVTCTTVRLLPLSGTWRNADLSGTTTIASIVEYLRQPPGAQLVLGFEDNEVDLG